MKALVPSSTFPLPSILLPVQKVMGGQDDAITRSYFIFGGFPFCSRRDRTHSRDLKSVVRSFLFFLDSIVTNTLSAILFFFSFSFQHRIALTLEERNLLSVAYKNVIGARRASWRMVNTIQEKEQQQGNQDRVDKLQAYRTKIEGELTATCADILQVLDEDVIPFVDADAVDECNVFYYKM